jgi:hypothetical protein
MKLKKLAIGVGMALSLIGGSANAALLSFEDDNIDFLLNSDGSAKTSGSFAIGDILVSIFEIGTYTIDGVNAIPDGMELTGVAAIQLSGGTGTVLDPWTFTYTDLGLNTWSDTDVVGGGAGEGATIAMFFNSNVGAENLDINFSSNEAGSCTSLANCITAATTGTLVQVDGFFGDLDEFWTSVATIAGGGDVDVVGGTNGALGVAQFNAAQTTIFNKDGVVTYQDIATGDLCPTGTMGEDGCVAGPVLTGPITGGAGLNDGITAEGAFARSDFDFEKHTVPEPGVVGLLGLGLMGLAVTRRRRSA